MKVYVSNKATRNCVDLRDARLKVIIYCGDHHKTSRSRGRKFSGGKVIDENGKHIATVAMNGAVWPAESWTPETKPLINADGTTN